ncbi:hypothetical protein CMI37_01355 [Candidatus Pacearchaeota archaeon]|nr:hypothetical protein [Candidatus Pacearchaeota archaeon]|tara:strand:+ start:3693 stop:3920 length:228 start_codon:yes stop_codon:yes gene_type:complete
MQQGDLIYIPQAVLLFDRNNKYIEKTLKPTVGIFIEEIPVGSNWMGGNYIVYARGREAAVAMRNTYPIGDTKHAS